MRVAVCPLPAELKSFRAGALAGPQAARVADHLQTCAACRLLVGQPAGPVSDRRTDPDLCLPEADTEIDFPALPTEIGPYRVVRLIGQGGMGVVYETVHKELGSRAAVKVLSRAAADAEARSRFRREWLAVGRLDHPNVVRGLTAGYAAGVPYLAMEYVPGVDLGKLVRQAGRLAPADAAAVVAQAARGLAHAHAGGVVHRDAKPSNLLLTPGGVVKVLDLGLARLAGGGGSSRLTRHTYLGTADYMAPEQWNDPAAVGPPADVYALGCVLHHLLTGRPPFTAPEHPSPRAKMLAHLTAPAPDPRTGGADPPDGLVAVLHRMLAKAPADRPDAARVAAALAPLAAGARLDRLLELGTATGLGFNDGPPTVPLPAASDPATVSAAEPGAVAPVTPPPIPRIRRRPAALAGAVVAFGAFAAAWSAGRPAPRPAAAVDPPPPPPAPAPREPGFVPPGDARPAGRETRPVATLDGFRHPLVGVALAPDGETAFTAERDGTIYRWDLSGRTGTRLTAPANPTPARALRGLALTPAGGELVAFTARTVAVLDARTGAPRQTVGTDRDVWAVAVSPDGRWLAVGHDTGPPAPGAGDRPAVSLYDLTTGERAAEWTGPAGTRVSVSYGPTGRGTVLAVDATGRTAALDPARPGAVTWAAGHAGETLVSVTPILGGWRAASVFEREIGADRPGARRLVCRVFDATTGAAAPDMVGPNHTGWTATAAGAAAGGSVGAVGTSTGQLIIRGPAVAPDRPPLAAHPGGVACVAVAAGGRRVVSAGADDRTVRVWDVPLTAAR